ncbi:DUF167 domain-containing protein [Pelagicoccus sp. SDUM812002]|uniref:DUF167 domain-containing protein n=1 Tax=Pelagicoccus sp. SDUM812002 TaxID=3041266 RepID=UPI0028103324|nr:DUF167 domain-containing protein [Pelagicoccus sp. SDUM812002]MDQ8186233.1 DUF167 domain-containing protein [Pelagicoccus sp. SDUM812002]
MPSSPTGQHTLSVKVVPNAATSEFAGWLDESTLKIRIQSPAQDGKANKALIAFLAKQVGVSKNQISIARGETSKQKLIAFERLSSSQFANLPRP